MKALPARPGAQRRPILVPSAPSLHPDESAEGADVLLEHPGALGVPLWGALRDFMLWVHTPAGERTALFGPGAGDLRRAALLCLRDEPELWAPLLTLAQMTEAPGRADHGRLVHAVRSLARWAERRGAPGTRLAFTQAAALALPDQPAAALDAARQARDLARHAQAETWFRRAIRLSRGRDWESYAWGFIGLGVLYMRAGNYPAARAVVCRALRTARKRRLRGVTGSAHHHLFVFSSDAGRTHEAYQHARAALHAYGERHPRLPALAHDLGCFWAEQGWFSRALPVIQAAIPLLADTSERVMALANVARASAGAGDRETYESSRAEVMSVLDDPAFSAIASEALVVLAQGDSSLGEWARAEAAATRAVSSAGERGEGRIRMVAEAQLDAIRAARVIARSGRVQESDALALEAEALAEDLRASLTRRALQAAAAA
ncbi:MAG TPA: tetratricopeptide repeat protein [Longimicrobium sp.]|nr:tetratricopeptide repeat protein [Longimicrobium sp.]